MKTKAQTRGAEDGGALLAEEGRVAGQQTVGAGGVEGLGGEHAQQDGADHAADAVHAPDVERVVPAAAVLEGHGEEADEARGEADH